MWCVLLMTHSAFEEDSADPPAVLRYLTWKGPSGQPEVGREIR